MINESPDTARDVRHNPMRIRKLGRHIHIEGMFTDFSAEIRDRVLRELIMSGFRATRFLQEKEAEQAYQELGMSGDNPYVAPDEHLTWSMYEDQENSMQKVKDQYNTTREHAARLLHSMGIHGYQEEEIVMDLFPPEEAAGEFLEDEELDLDLQKYSCSTKGADIHLTFRSADPRLIRRLIKAGFYVTFMRTEKGKLKIILTAQGTASDMKQVSKILLSYFARARGCGDDATFKLEIAEKVRLSHPDVLIQQVTKEIT